MPHAKILGAGERKIMVEIRETSGKATPALGERSVAFGDVRFDVRSGEIRHDQRVVQLTPRAASVLALLIDRAQQLVTKQEMIDRIWDGRVVGDEALTSCIQELRRALDDNARQPRYIETRHRRGYRLIPSVTELAAPQSVTQAEKPSVAILPFDNLSPDPAHGYLADGLVEDMTTALSRFGLFFVVSRNSAFTFKGRTVPVQEVGRALGVRYVVEGSVRRAGQKLRLTVQLVEAATGHHIWAERYDGDFTDVFELQDRIVEHIVGSISPSVRKAEIDRARMKRPENLQAYDYMLRAHPGLWLLEEEPHAEAMALLAKAIELDPTYAFAMARLAWCHSQRFSGLMRGDPEFHRRRAIELATDALRLDSEDPNVLIAAGTAYMLTRADLDRSLLLFRKALARDPNSWEGWQRLGIVHYHRSEADEAIEASERALRVGPRDPMGVYTRFNIGNAHFIAGRLEQAIAIYRAVLAERPGDPTFRRRFCAVLAMAGKLDEARALARELIDQYPDVTLERVAAVLPFRPELRDRYLDALRSVGFI
jgi:adenylate cyclase